VCAALPEVADCSSASVTPAGAQCRCRVKAQIDPRVLLADAAGRDHCPARRVGPRLRAVDASTHRSRSRHRAHRRAPL